MYVCVCVCVCVCGNFDKPKVEIEWNSIAIRCTLTAIQGADLIIHIRLQIPHSCSEPYVHCTCAVYGSITIPICSRRYTCTCTCTWHVYTCNLREGRGGGGTQSTQAGYYHYIDQTTAHGWAS